MKSWLKWLGLKCNCGCEENQCMEDLKRRVEELEKLAGATPRMISETINKRLDKVITEVETLEKNTQDAFSGVNRNIVNINGRIDAIENRRASAKS